MMHALLSEIPLVLEHSHVERALADHLVDEPALSGIYSVLVIL